MHTNPAIDRLEYEVRALEKAYANNVINPRPSVNMFALGNKIKKKKKELQDLKGFEWLAR